MKAKAKSRRNLRKEARMVIDLFAAKSIVRVKTIHPGTMQTPKEISFMVDLQDEQEKEKKDEIRV